MQLPKAAEQFLSYLEHEKRSSPHTVTNYRSDLRRFIAYLKERRIPCTVDNVTTQVVRQYVVYLSKAHYAPVTIGRRIACLKSLFSYLQMSGRAMANPLIGIAKPKEKRRLPTFLNIAECQCLMKAAEDTPYVDLAFRNRAIVGTFLYAGLRRSELVALKLGDVDLEATTLRIHQGKGGRDRIIPICEELKELLEDWLEFRPDADHDAFFTAQGGDPLGVRGLWSMFKRLVDRAGLAEKNVTIHTLRHTFASVLLQNGADLVSIQRLLGHSSLDTTAIYLHVQMDGLREAVEKHPLSAG